MALDAPMEIRAPLERGDIGGSEWRAGRHGRVSASQRRRVGALVASRLDVRRAPEPPESCGKHPTKPLTRFFAPPGPPGRLLKSRGNRRGYLAEKRGQFNGEAVDGFTGHDAYGVKSAVAELTA